MSLLDAALRLVAHGYVIFPVVPLAKNPLTEHGFKDASRDQSQVRAWWSDWKNANIGLPCGDNGLVVLDVDSRKPGADVAFDELRSRGGGIPETLCVQTPSRGCHYYFTAQGLKTTHGVLGIGLDVQAAGAYVIAPPSRTCAGSYITIDRCPIAPAPPWLIEFASPKPVGPSNPYRSPPIPRGARTAYGAGALRRAGEAVAAAKEGVRNRELHFAAYSLGRLVAGGHLAADDVRSTLLAAARACGYTEDDGERNAEKVIESSMSKGHETGPRGPAPSWAC